ncbi:hypothetical protein N9Q68_01895 [Polaribacter sp.]|nr:hypothetical protein [Polaribacter sp.]
MKSIIDKTSIKILLIITFVVIVSFTIYQSVLVQEEKQLIIGTWIVGDEVTNKWNFTSNNECKWELDGVITSEFTYIIESDFSTSGLEHTFLKLTTINSAISEVGEIIEYGIIGLGDAEMMLEYKTGVGISYTQLTKQ